MFDQDGGIVQIQVDGNKVWVNVDGKCALRVFDAGTIEVEVDGKLKSKHSKGENPSPRIQS